MARLARVIVVDVAHHITQRGNARQFLLASDTERTVYLDLLRQSLQDHPLTLLGYCLMSNHVHLVAIPRKKEALANALKRARTVRRLLERSARLQRTRLAGPVLLLPAG